MNNNTTFDPVTISTGQTFPVESDEEKWFLWWADEMIQAGQIESISRGETFQLAANVQVNDRVFGKEFRERKDKTSVLFQDQVYTPDFSIVWPKNSMLVAGWKERSLKPIFRTNVTEDGIHFSIFEVKGGFMDNSKKRISSILIKWTMQRHDQYVQLVQLHNDKKSFFDQTFTPVKFLLTDKTLKPRKIKYETKPIATWLASLNQAHPDLH